MLRQHWLAVKSCQRCDGKNRSCQHKRTIFFAHGVLGRVFGSLLPTQAHASFKHACVRESALIGLSLPLLSLPCCPYCAPMLSSFSCPPCQVCVNAGSLVCVPALAHWCVCPVCTCVLIDPCCLSVKGYGFSHSQHLIH
jgi:hypothetical protein